MADPYRSLVGGQTKFAGIDQGIDFTGAGPVYALGSGKITRIASNTTWPGRGNVLVYSVDSLNKFVYVAEDFIARANLKVGDVVQKGEVLGLATGEGRAPGIEIGFATSAGVPVAPLPPPRPASQWTQAGQDFLNFVTGAVTGPGGHTGAPGGPTPGGGGSATGAITNAAGEVWGVVKGVLTWWPPGTEGLQIVAKTGDQAAALIDTIPKFLKKITDPNLWIRILQIAGGSVLFLAGLYLLVKDVGLGVNVPAPGPVAKVAASV